MPVVANYSYHKLECLFDPFHNYVSCIAVL